MKKQSKFPPGWDEDRVRRVLSYYEEQTEEEAVAEDEAAFEQSQTVMEVPLELVPVVRELIARHRAKSKGQPSD
jgi:hypothetical protein